jgi:hypothetical protein
MASAVGVRLVVNTFILTVTSVILGALTLTIAAARAFAWFWDHIPLAVSLTAIVALGTMTVAWIVLVVFRRLRPGSIGSRQTQHRITRLRLTLRLTLSILVVATFRQRWIIYLVCMFFVWTASSRAAEIVHRKTQPALRFLICIAALLIPELAIYILRDHHGVRDRARAVLIALLLSTMTLYAVSSLRYEDAYAESLFKNETPSPYIFWGGPPGGLRSVRRAIESPASSPASQNSASAGGCFVLIGTKDGLIVLFDVDTRRLQFVPTSAALLEDCVPIPPIPVTK